jgi:pimeloyl-ACP methyl ester carboxylesterase
MQMLAKDLVFLMDHLNIERASILGFSMGGNIALEFALTFPQRVSQLVLAATFAQINSQARLFIDAVLSVYEGGCTARQMFELIAPI